MNNSTIESKSNFDNINQGLSRRRMIRTLGLGLSATALPSFMSSSISFIPVEALDHGEFIIPVEERELIEMEKFISKYLK